MEALISAGQYGLVQISADLMRDQYGLVQISADLCGNVLGLGFFNSEKMTFLDISDMYLAVLSYLVNI